MFLILVSLNIWSVFLFGPMNQVYRAKQLQRERFGAICPHHSTQLCNDWRRLQSRVKSPLWLKQHKRLRSGFSHTHVVGSQAKGDIFWSCLGVSVPPAAAWLVSMAVFMFQSQHMNLGSQAMGWFGAPSHRAVPLGSRSGLGRTALRDQSRGVDWAI